MTPVIDLACDLNADDDEGRGWAVMGNAREPKSVRPGVVLIARHVALLGDGAGRRRR